MKQMFKAALAATVVLGAASAARADLTISGAVGLPLNPTAQIPDAGGMRVQANYADLGSIGAGDAKAYGLFTAANVADNIEISGGINKLSAPNGSPLANSGFALGAKYLFTRESDPTGVRLAAGIGYDKALVRNMHAYVVGTKSLGNLAKNRVPVVGHLGLRYDRFDQDLGAPGDTSSKVSVYGGVELPLARTGEFQGILELQSKNSEFAGAKVPYSAAVRYRPVGKPFGITAGFQRQGLTGDNGVFVQLGYTFNTSK